MTRDEAERLRLLAGEAKLVGPETAGWVERLTPKRQELVEAARFLIQNSEEEVAVELAAAVWRLWLLTGDLARGRQMLAVVLDGGQRKPSRARALALYGDGLLAFRAGAMPDSISRNDEALAVARSIGDREAEALALVGLSRVALRNGDYARVRALAVEARLLTADLDARAGVAPLHLLAAGTRLAGDYDRAAELYSESLQLNQRLGDRRMVGMELLNLGHVELHRGNIDRAERCFAESATVRSKDDPYETAMTHLSEAAAAVARGERQRGAVLLERAESTLREAGIVLDPDDASEVQWLKTQLASSVATHPDG